MARVATAVADGHRLRVRGAARGRERARQARVGRVTRPVLASRRFVSRHLHRHGRGAIGLLAAGRSARNDGRRRVATSAATSGIGFRLGGRDDKIIHLERLPGALPRARLLIPEREMLQVTVPSTVHTGDRHARNLRAIHPERRGLSRKVEPKLPSVPLPIPQGLQLGVVEQSRPSTTRQHPQLGVSVPIPARSGRNEVQVNLAAGRVEPPHFEADATGHIERDRNLRVKTHIEIAV